jgi:hypothetical protein
MAALRGQELARPSRLGSVSGYLNRPWHNHKKLLRIVSGSRTFTSSSMRGPQVKADSYTHILYPWLTKLVHILFYF